MRNTHRLQYPKQAKPSTSKTILLEYEGSEESDNCMTPEQYKPGPMSFELFTYNAYMIQKEDSSRLPVSGKFNVLSAGLVKLATKAVTSYKKELEREAKELANTTKMETKTSLDKRIDLS
ncbi:hypothetical protein GN958_ATG14928 [Phytophthora infestans]|uniref:Uncharacterized protein n=1 Tax=Phytophthora infestans TaxID=4787 RepID=A0A8S9U8Q7_PHYIN|nr:hypothetical protein GN958_ATG14928 [Phytophthora infestans]